jgi:C-5 cytosine-specific DNA methylase
MFTKKRGGKKIRVQSTAQVRATISFPSDVYETLEVIAKQKKVSLAWVVREATGTISRREMALFAKREGGSHLKNDNHLIRQRIARIARGGRPRVLDLFAGCGGLSLGFQGAGFQLAAAVEFDPDAAASHGLNFHGGDIRHSKAGDITKLTPEALAATWTLALSTLQSTCLSEVHPVKLSAECPPGQKG